MAARPRYSRASIGTSGCSPMSTGSTIGCAAIELRLSIPWSSTAMVSRGVETRWAPTGVLLRGPLGLARGVTVGLGCVPALGRLDVAIRASARIAGVITGVGAVDEKAAGGGAA